MAEMKYPMDNKEFMIWFKAESEKHFWNKGVDKEAYGLHFQKVTKWNDGLSEVALNDFQKELSFEFPEELKLFYKTMNGTNTPGVNVFGESGMEYEYRPILYSFPEHLTHIKGLIDVILEIKNIDYNEMMKHDIPFIFPIEDSYFMIIDNLTNPIYYLSTGFKDHDPNKPIIHSSLYADTLQSFLIKSVLKRTNHISDLEEFPDRNRKSNYWT